LARLVLAGQEKSVYFTSIANGTCFFSVNHRKTPSKGICSNGETL